VCYTQNVILAHKTTKNGSVVRNAISIWIIIVVLGFIWLVSYNPKHINCIQHILELLMHMENCRTIRIKPYGPIE